MSCQEPLGAVTVGSMDETIRYMDYLWVTSEDGVVTVGVDEDAAADLSDELTLNLPEEDDVVMAGKVCGDIESESGNLNLYSPVSGTVLEVNEAILDNPSLILEDPLDEGWLFKVEADDPAQIDKLRKSPAAATDEDDEEEDDDLDDEDDYDDEEDLVEEKD